MSTMKKPYKAWIIEAVRVPLVEDDYGYTYSSCWADHCPKTWEATCATLEEAMAKYAEMVADKRVIAAAVIEWQSGDVAPMHGIHHHSYAWRNCTGCMPSERGVCYGERYWTFDHHHSGKITIRTGEWTEQDVSKVSAEHLFVSAPKPTAEGNLVTLMGAGVTLQGEGS